ncbi:LLM class flavin-dependent oxidoreductase [Lacticigenium naphthae]|uniref:LLM class flavin-dependent oxidoreductase n=1 Tax=Lacticigenium naphthae TaxID=515351 RepID=UPI00042692A1|nr:LLM class flavin-dependent oxidoreductase [Lacticigenium naphthae]
MKFGILDYLPNTKWLSNRKLLDNRIETAKLAEKYGFNRYWFSDQKRNTLLVGRTPELILSHLVKHTRHIQLGTPAVLYPFYDAEKINESYSILGQVYDGRFNLGYAQAPQDLIFWSMQLNEENLVKSGFENEVKKIKQTKFMPEIFIMGSTMESAQIAGEKGVGFVYTFHMQPQEVLEIIKHYRTVFKNYHPNKNSLVLFTCFVIVEDSHEKAEDEWASFLKWYAATSLPNPEEILDISEYGDTSIDETLVDEKSVRGTPLEVLNQLKELEEKYKVDEFLLILNIHEPQKSNRGLITIGQLMD